jgi:hypothetical protein
VLAEQEGTGTVLPLTVYKTPLQLVMQQSNVVITLYAPEATFEAGVGGSDSGKPRYMMS